ncbi:MAG TPA: hypothetical protein VFR37_19460 [Longimicrobium sp.]|nr:hypothetical protein [Longimicrobium sp.]
MEKLTLRLDELCVDTFHTEPAGTARGTVAGAQDTSHTICTGPACETACYQTCEVTCQEETCAWSCHETCLPGSCFPNTCDHPTTC